LSQEALQKPIVADLMGYLYNKETLIQYLLERSKYEAGPSYVKNLKDVKELNLTNNPGYIENQVEKGNEFIDTNRSKWICSITGLEMNGYYKFYCLFSCGCVISERALKSMQSTFKCLNCDKSYTDMDLIVLNPNDDDLESNKEKYNIRKSLVKSTNKKLSTSVAASSEVAASTSSSKDVNNHKRSHTQSQTTSSETAKRPKSIQDDPNVSSVFKSLFTTCEKAKNQQKAHWVTYNPQYN
jgi:hypothetical protein